MNITFLIGNGFDLNCGLKSSYHDIYLEYIKQPSDSEIIRKFKNDLRDDIDNWGDFEVAMSEYMDNFNSEQAFLECLRDYIDFMEDYLTKEQRKILGIDDPNIFNKIAIEMEESLSKFHKGVTNSLDKLDVQYQHINVIVYNYTSVFDRLYSCSRERYPFVNRIIHIHGKLEDHDIVMGMDNINQIHTKNYTLSRKGKRAFIKSEFNIQWDKDRMIDAEAMISDSDIICVFGMTLGESDIKWRNQILELLKSDSNSHFFIYQYDCSILPQMRAERKMDIEEDKKTILLESWGITGDEIDDYFNQIHIPCCKNIFNFKEVIEKETTRLQKIKEQNKKRPIENALKR